MDMRLKRMDYTRQAKSLNLMANTKREATLLLKQERDRQIKLESNKATNHQMTILNHVSRNGLLCPTVLHEQPSVYRHDALSMDATETDLVPIDDQPAMLTEHSDQRMPLQDVAEQTELMHSAQFLHQHGDGLHGLGDCEFGLSEQLVSKAMQMPGFVKQSDLQFQSEHSRVCADKEFPLDESDEVENVKSCQQLCGRFCRTSITNVDVFHRIADMVKSVARVVASRRDVRNGNTFHLSPSCLLPILIIHTPSCVVGRLACRITFKPLEIDWVHCDVEHFPFLQDSGSDEEQPIYKVRLQFQDLQGSDHLCPVIDTTCEFAVWMSQNFKVDQDAGYSCSLHLAYDLDEIRDDVLIIRAKHKFTKAHTFGENTFQGVIVPKKRKEPVVEDELASVSNILSLMGRDKPKNKRQPRQQPKPKTQLLPARPKDSSGSLSRVNESRDH